jgi:hypothetical protein
MSTTDSPNPSNNPPDTTDTTDTTLPARVLPTRRTRIATHTTSPSRSSPSRSAFLLDSTASEYFVEANSELETASSMASSGQGLTLVPFSAQLEPCLTPKNTLHTLNTP